MLSKSQFVVYPSLDIRQVTAIYEEGKDFPVCFFLLDEKTGSTHLQSRSSSIQKKRQSSMPNPVSRPYP